MPQDPVPTKAETRLDNLEAYLQSLKIGADAALSTLRDKDDADSILRQTLILIEAGRIDEAANLVRSREPDARWCEYGVIALTLHGELEPARKLIAWAQSTGGAVYRRCVLVFVQNQFQMTFKSRPPAEVITPQNIQPEERGRLNALVEVLSPLLNVARVNRSVSSELESEVFQIGIKTSYLLGNKALATELATLLLTRKPLPLILGDAVLGRWIDAIPATLTERLRSDYDQDDAQRVHAHCLAAVIEGEFLGKPKDAFESAIELIGRATTAEAKEEVYKVLNDLCQKLGAEARTRLNEVSPSLLKDNARFSRLLEAETFLRKGETDSAAKVLEENKDEGDSLWLQMRANVLLQQGQSQAAIDILLKVCEILPHPHVLRMTADLAFSHERLPDAVTIYEKILQLEPRDVRVRNNLALIYIKAGYHRQAAQQFKELRSLKPDEPAYGVNEAVSLVGAGDLEGALNLYEELCSSPQLRVEAVIGRAGVLVSLNRQEQAFKSLDAFRQRFWGDPAFLSAYLNIGFAANHEREGHEALLEIQRLQKDGKAEAQVLRTASLEDILKLTEEHKRQREEILNSVLGGKLPWLVAEQLLGRSPYWAWFIKTQPVDWLLEQPSNRAEYSVYSTNGSFVFYEADGTRSLEEPECPKAGQSIVIDQSSLITLHRLGLLDKTAKYFGKILVPSEYLTTVLEDSRHLVTHQKSQKLSLESVKKAIDSRKLVLLADVGFPSQRPLPFVHEYATEDEKTEHHYHLRDVLDVLKATGNVSDARHKEVLSIAQQPSGVDSDHPALRPAQKVWIDLSTLKVLHSFGLFDAALDALSVHISIDDRDEVVRDTSAILAQEQVYDWNEELWTSIRKDTRFVQTLPQLPATLPKSEDEQKQKTHISAMLLALEVKLPLLSDDRVCQNELLKSARSNPEAAFGSNHLITALHNAGVLTADEAADAFLQLIRWRYRFVIPTREVLLTLGARFAESPPGKPLREVARYLHECMRDPGLFGGLEPTDPPASIAARLFVTCARNVAEFAMIIWADTRFTDTNAEALTVWAIQELLPSTPKALGDAQRAAVAEAIPNLVMANAFIQSVKVQTVARANKGLVCISNALGLDDRRYAKILTETINAP